MNSRKAALYGIVLLAFVLEGCARTQVISVWKKEDFKGPPVESLVILAQTGGMYSRTAWEESIAERYRRSGIQAVSALSLFPENQEARIDRVIARAGEKGVEGVLVIRHVRTRTEETYHPPRTHYYYAPRYYSPYYYGPYRYHRYYRWYDPFYPPYYYYDYDIIVTPGYTAYHRAVIVESYLYHSASGEQVWSMSTETTDPLSADSLVADLSRSTFRSLMSNGLIRLVR